MMEAGHSLVLMMVEAEHSWVFKMAAAEPQFRTQDNGG
jgi:hypothetical protein